MTALLEYLGASEIDLSCPGSSGRPHLLALVSQVWLSILGG